MRIEISDGRQYIGLFSSIDKTGTLFAMDCLEMHDLSKGFHHDLFVPYQLNQPVEGNQVLKYVGNIVVKREHVKRILLDKKGQQLFEELKQKVLKGEFVNE